MAKSKKKVISARQASWYYLQALEACDAIAERQELIHMMVEEILLLQQEIAGLSLPLPSWDPPRLTVQSMEAALEVGYAVAAQMQDLRNYIRAETNGKVWPDCRYDKRVIWPEGYGSLQRELGEDGTASAQSSELPTWGLIDGRKVD
ncbi:MAG: hypothetical protein AAFX93_20455 [Verrucomicrobiota bacterium]